MREQNELDWEFKAKWIESNPEDWYNEFDYH